MPRCRPLAAEAGRVYIEFTHPKLAGNWVAVLLCSTMPSVQIETAAGPHRYGSAEIDSHARASGLDRRPGPELLLRGQASAGEHLDRHPAQSGHRVHRTIGLRQEHVPAHAEPDERHHRRHAGRRPRPHRRRRCLRSADGRRGAPAARRNGVPEVEPISEVDLREHRVRDPAQRARVVAIRAARRGSRRASRQRRSGTKSRIASTSRRLPVRRPAAAAVHRARARRQAARSC